MFPQTFFQDFDHVIKLVKIVKNWIWKSGSDDGKLMLVTSLRTGDAFVYEAETHELVKNINTGKGAAGILADNDVSRAFIGCAADGYVAVIGLKTLQVTGHIPVGGANEP
ncbi:MAG TPA: hypothetical protein VFE53_02465 [Mucilaginibacter sp.]|nr:hypothetical protein [Mucilaginibacter sp.]